VPILPLLQEGSSGDYGMFQDFRKYRWVQPVFRYKDLTYLINSLDTNVNEPSEAKARELEKR